MSMPLKPYRVYMITVEGSQTKDCVVAINYEEAIKALKVSRNRAELWLPVTGIVEIARVDAIQGD